MSRPTKLRPQDAYIMKTIVDEGCGGNISMFAAALNINRTSISSVIAGKYSLAPYLDKIRKVFPGVSEKFLETGEGYPGDLSARQVRENLEAVIKEKEAQIARLTLEMEMQRKVIEMLLPKDVK
nr:MAG TPA: Helix-turn-helix of insertion element transposase [Caudoviricetes sp.]